MLKKVPLPTSMQKEEFLIGHRGCRNVPWPESQSDSSDNENGNGNGNVNDALNGIIPELSNEALSYAIDKGYNAIEIDVWLTKDNKIVANHDSKLSSVGINKNIYDLNLNEIQKLNFKNNENRALNDTKYVNNILTLEYILNEFIVNKNTVLFLEIKDTKNPYKLADKIIDLLYEFYKIDTDIFNKVVAISFNPYVLYRIKKNSNHNIHIGLLFVPELYKGRIERGGVHVHWLLQYTHWIVDPILTYLCKYFLGAILGTSIVGTSYQYVFKQSNMDYIEYCKKNNIKLFLWGYDSDKKMCKDYGVWCETDS